MRYNYQPLTLEQQKFAEDNHDLIYKFLRAKRLSDDYYSIIILGYIRAVLKYFDRPELRQYSFNTIASAAMRSDLINHYRKQGRQKRYAVVVSLDAPVSYNERLIDIIPDTAADDVIYNSLMNKIAEILPAEQFDIIRMKAEGYRDREIARHYGIPVYSVQNTLSSVKNTVYALI